MPHSVTVYNRRFYSQSTNNFENFIILGFSQHHHRMYHRPQHFQPYVNLIDSNELLFVASFENPQNITRAHIKNVLDLSQWQPTKIKNYPVAILHYYYFFFYEKKKPKWKRIIYVLFEMKARR